MSIDIFCSKCKRKHTVNLGTTNDLQCASCGPVPTIMLGKDADSTIIIKCLACGNIRKIETGKAFDPFCPTEKCNKLIYVIEPDSMSQEAEFFAVKSQETVEVSVVVLCHNKLDITKICIDHIRKSAIVPQIVLVDNASTDDTQEWAAKQNDIKYVRNQVNLGCAIGRNQGARWSTGKHLLFLDNDQYIPSDYISKCLECSKDFDIVGCELWQVGEDGWTSQANEHSKNSYIGGGGLFMLREMFLSMGGFDERFAPCWFEDVDFSMRARFMGLKLGNIKHHRVKHIGGQTSAFQRTYDSGKAKYNSHKLFTSLWLPFLFSSKIPEKIKPGNANNVIRMSKGKRPRVLFLVDVVGWAWWNKCVSLRKFLPDFVIDIKTVTGGNIEKVDMNYDLYFTFCPSQVPWLSGISRERVFTGVTCHPQFTRWFAQNGFKYDKLNIHANSKMLLHLLEKLGKYDRLYYLPNGIDEELFPYSERDITEPFTVGFVGKPNPQKGYEEFVVKACRLAGVKLKSRVGKYSSPGMIEYSKMSEFYRGVDCIMIASTMDGTPNPLLEAASVGRCFVSNSIGNVPEFYNEKNGILVERDISKYVNALLSLKEDRVCCQLMGKEARKTVEQHWSWKIQAERYRKMFNEVLERLQ